MTTKTEIAIYWFRKCLRVHDNPALIKCLQKSGDTTAIAPIFILDPWFVKNAKVGKNRWKFLQESLDDLNKSLIKFGSRLYVLRGSPTDVFDSLISKHTIKCIAFETDTEPYALKRDGEILKLAKEHSISIVTAVSHTLYNPDSSIALNGGSAPKTYQSFNKLMDKLGPPAQAVAAPETIGRLPPDSLWAGQGTHIPTDEELSLVSDMNIKFPGGETEALRRMTASLSNKDWVCKFEKPSTSPNSLKPSTTVLSPYLKFGCLSPRLFYHKLSEVYQGKKHSAPPVSLHGQLIWREFFYTVGFDTPNFDRMEGNPLCKQIPWIEDEEKLNAWKKGQTGFPFIDAIMRQLAQEGWIHHLARHSVACFLTRGDLWISWEKGMQVFEEYLLDADWSLNAANWMWLSASAFFHQYYRVYSPIAFGKKTDKTGAYIRKYVPELKDYPTEYIYEPWKASLGVQKACKCVIGKDYPHPIVDHDTARKENLERMGKAYKSQPEPVGKNTKNNVTKTKTPAAKHKLSDSSSKSKDSPLKKKQKLK